MFSQRKMLYSLGDQKIFIFPLEKKPARGRTEVSQPSKRN